MLGISIKDLDDMPTRWIERALAADRAEADASAWRTMEMFRKMQGGR